MLAGLTFAEMVQLALLDTLCHVALGYMIVIVCQTHDRSKEDAKK